MKTIYSMLPVCYKCGFALRLDYSCPFCVSPKSPRKIEQNLQGRSDPGIPIGSQRKKVDQSDK